MTFEDFASNWSPSEITISSSSPASKQTVVLHDDPAPISSTTITQLVTTDKVAAVYITDDEEANNGVPYDSLPSYWTTLVSDVASAQ